MGSEGEALMLQCWKGLTNRHLINFLVYCNQVTVFGKSFDANVSQDANYYHN